MASADSTQIPETFSFSADISQLMSLIINTFYSNKDIFLRELISNASDALDKIRYASLTDPTVLEDGKDFEIKLSTDNKQKLLIIEDTGIGMTKQDLINHLGTIAKSGTKAFMEALQAGADVSMIGQFGVGFYSAYLVAKNVTVISKHRNDDEYTWSSAAGGSFTIAPSSTGLKRGTRIILELKEGCESFLRGNTLKNLVKKHSNFIDFKISLLVHEEKEEEVTDDEEEVEKEEVEKEEVEKEEVEKEEIEQEENEKEEIEKEDVEKDSEKESGEEKEGVVEEVEEVEEKKKEKKMKKIKVKTQKWVHLNKNKPLWLRKPEDITHEEYSAFYKSISDDWADPQKVTHFNMEGQLEFTSMLFLPSRAEYNIFQKYDNELSDIKLYVRKVFITDKCIDLLPKWLSFMKGVVDSTDLPLNISREKLQQNKILTVISKTLVKKSFDLFNELAEDEEEYNKFYNNFSKAIKLGVHEDYKNKNKLVKLLRYKTNKSDNSFISLDNYIQNMDENQKHIYYMTGSSIDEIKSSPFLEALNKKNIECLFMDEPIDEYVVQQMNLYDKKKLVSVTKEGFELETNTEEKNIKAEEVENMKMLCKRIKDVLGDKVVKVVVSNRIVDSPCCLVTSAYGYSANMERIMKAQMINSGGTNMSSKKTMEINASHSIIKRLRNKINDTDSVKMAADLIWLLYETTVLTSGFSLEKPTLFASRIHKLIDLGLSDDDEEEEEEERIETEAATGAVEGSNNMNLVVNDFDTTEAVEDMEEID